MGDKKLQVFMLLSIWAMNGCIMYHSITVWQIILPFFLPLIKHTFAFWHIYGQMWSACHTFYAE